MARKMMNMAVLLAIVGFAAMFHGSMAQTTHVVGDALGWLVPPGGSAAYSGWASQYNFTVGDSLLFNFTTGFHDVAEVNRAAFDSCDSTNPIILITTGPATIPLTTPGPHYFFCTFGRHCSLGQLVAINVSAAASTTPSPSPAPSTPPPATTPTPTPPPASTPSPTPSAPAPTPVATPPTSPSPSAPTPSPPSPATPPSPPAPTPASQTPPPPPPPPPSSSSAPFVVAALPVTFLSIALALFY